MTSTGALGKSASIVDVDASALANGQLQLAAGSGEPRRLVTCGRPPAGAEITVIDPETGAVLDAGQVGELVVRGPHVTRGYWGREQGAAASRATRSAPATSAPSSTANWASRTGEGPDHHPRAEPLPP